MAKSIVFYGWYGAGNVGDELLLNSLLSWARHNFLEPVVISYDTAYTEKTHNVRAVDVEDVPAVVNAIADSVACVLGGGGIFQTHDSFTYGGLFDFGGGDIAAYARPLILAQQLGVPYILIGQGVGPLAHDAASDIVRRVFDSAHLVSVRDEASLALLKTIGVEREVLLAPDLVWSLPVPELPVRQFEHEGRTRIALVIRPWSETEGFEDRLIAAIQMVLNPKQYTLVWIPFQSHAIPYRSGSDEDFIRQCMAKLGPEWCQECIIEDLPDRVIHALVGCDAIIAMRLHAQILALKLGKPTLCVEYDAKMAEVSNQVKLDAGLRIRPEDDTPAWNNALARLSNHTLRHGFQYGRIVQLTTEASMRHFDALDTFWASVQQGLDTRPQIRLRDVHWFEYWLMWIGKQIEARNDAEKAELKGQIASLNEAVDERDKQITSLNEAVDERDKQITSLNEAVDERDKQITFLNTNLHMLKQSISWRVTSPLRVIKNLVIAPKRTTYQLFRSIFWRLPPFLRQGLHRPRHAFVRFVRNLPSSQTSFESSSVLTDISWMEFNREILSKREEYKGIFVQELVIDWNVPLYQRPQHLSAALGRIGYLVIYRTDNWAGDNVCGFREVSKNVWITNRYEVDEIQGVVRSLYSTAYAHTPDLLLRNGKRGVLVYEYIDHIDPEISGDKENINRLLALKNFAFEGGAEFIVASAKKLYEEAVNAVGKDKVVFIPNGVDTIHYRDPIHKKTLLPSSLIEFKEKYGTVVGYFGALAPWLWYECIQELASARPELGFVFIGPDYYGGAELLPKFDNILYLGTVDYKVLPAYAKIFDVCFIPFKPGEIAKTTSPLKLFEYFALEKPVVVSSDMNECTAYSEVFSGGSAFELSKALDDALKIKDDELFKVRLRELADHNDWTQRAHAMEVCFRGISNE